jgi:endonuclease/exonuclease/phosphatase family metal-dependent hydrolase
VRVFNLYDLENREENRNQIFDFLKGEDAGIYCFQEFYHQESKDFVTKDSLILLLNTPHYQERYTHELSNQRYFGVATFSKYPIIYKGEIPFENDANNFCIYSDIVRGSDTIRVFNAHIGSIRLQDDDYRFFDPDAPTDKYRNNESGQRILRRLKIGFEKRAPQIHKVAEEIEKSPYPVIVCGDLNDTPVSYCYRQLNRLLNDAFVTSGNGVGTTYIGKIPSNRIDYIFYSEILKAAHFQTHDFSCSDHRPISTEIGY